MKKKLLAMLFAVTLAFSLLPRTAFASETSGICGDNLTWTYSDGILTIQGTGPMEDYCLKYDDKRGDTFVPAPWYDYREQIHTVIIGEGVTSIGDVAFLDCASLTEVTIPGSVASIGYYAFRNCGSLTEVTIPDGVTSIGESAFQYCRSLTSVTIPDSVTDIGVSAFSYCGSLTRAVISDSVTDIAFSLFYHCGALTGVNIPDGVTTIGHRAFEGCASLTGVTIPDSVTYIGVSAFSDCVSLTELTIPDSVTVMEYGAFRGCTGLTSVTLPSGIATTGSMAFAFCGLTGVTIPNGVTTIGMGTFLGCASLAAITIPASVTTIELSAFYNCVSLKDVHYSGSKDQWDQITVMGQSAPFLNATIHYNSTGPISFPDVPSNAWYADAVFWAAGKGYIQGTGNGNFTPGRDCTNIEILTFLWNAEGQPKAAEAPVTVPDWARGPADWAYENGLIDASFKPYDQCTRATTVYYIWMAFGKEQPNGSSGFPDVDDGVYYAGAVAWAVEQNIVQGTENGTYAPNSVCSRAQIAAFLHRAYVPEART